MKTKCKSVDQKNQKFGRKQISEARNKANF